MKREFDFFIEEDFVPLQQWASEMRERGGIVTGSNRELIRVLGKQTLPGDEIACKLSGAWLDICVYRFVRDLLSQESQKRVLPERVVTEITVDIEKCLAYGEPITPLTLEERHNLFKRLVGTNVDDPRLEILPQ